MEGAFRSTRSVSTDSSFTRLPSTSTPSLNKLTSSRNQSLPTSTFTTYNSSSSPIPPRSGSLISLNSNHSSNSNTSNYPLGYTEEVVEESEDFFQREFTTSSFKTQSYLPSAIAPYWMSFSQASLNWDSIMNSAYFEGIKHGSAAFLASSKSARGESQASIVPKKCLDIGSGVPFFALSMANFEGWKTAEFFCLDIAPYSLPAELELPQDVISRITFVQCNFLNGLPFDDDSFDFVRMSYCGLGIPEYQWDIMSEFHRVLKPGCPIEIIDQDFQIFKKSPLPLSPPISPTSPTAHESSTPSDPFYLVEECFDAVLDSRFINSHILGIIPSQLAQYFTQIESSGTILIPLPARPPPPSSSHLPHTPFEASNGHLVSSSELGRQRKDHTLSSEISRIQLHAYAERLGSSTHGIARDSAAIEYERLRRKESLDIALLSESDRILLEKLQKKIPKNKRLEELEKERRVILSNWTSDLRERAGLAQVMENQWGWKCEVDLQAREILTSNIPAFKDALLEIEKGAFSTSSGGFRKFGSESLEETTSSKELESRRNQMTVGLRETEVELKAIERRLGNRNWEAGIDEVLGFLETAAFVAKAR